MSKEIIEAEIIASNGTKIKLRGSAEEIKKVADLFVNQKIGDAGQITGNKTLILSDNVFDIEGEKINLVAKDIPGRDMKNRAINTALVYLYGVSKVRKTDEANKKEIRETCKSYGCFDNSNFAAHMKSNKHFLISKGDNIKITKPGLNKAEELIKEINEGKSK